MPDKMPDSETPVSSRWTDLGLSYQEAMHGVQSAVAMEMLRGTSRDTEPKHLRVGINASMVEFGALTNLLINKGIVTEEEFFEELRLAANNELHLYEKKHGISFR